MGSELDSAVIKNLFQNEYKVVKILKFSPGYSYISYPEKAARGFNDWQYCAEILNTCDDEHTISGVISWVYDKERLRDYWTAEDLVKTKVTIHVYNKEGEEVGAVECDPDDYKGKDDYDRDGIRPDAVAVRLGAVGEWTGKFVELHKGSKWTATFNDLEREKNGKEIVYTVSVNNTDVLTGVDAEGTYASATTGDAEQGFTITNKHTPEPDTPVLYAVLFTASLLFILVLIAVRRREEEEQSGQ